LEINQGYITMHGQPSIKTAHRCSHPLYEKLKLSDIKMCSICFSYASLSAEN